MKHRQWIAISGFLWLAIGIFLLYKGLHWMAEASTRADSLSFQYQELFGGPQQVANAFIAIALFIGYIKGRFILSKTVNRVVEGIAKLSLPIHFTQVYSRKYFILIGSMIGLGLILKVAPIPVDIRGFVDVTVGTALIQGSILYFRAAREFICKT